MAAHHFPCHPAAGAANSSCYGGCYCSPYTLCHHHHHFPPHPESHPHPHPHPHLHPPPPYQPHVDQPHQYYNHFQDPYFQDGRQTHPTVAALLHRIAVLESALRRRSSHASTNQSLRNAAARTIQGHFRTFLLRRSGTLRQLKDLAAIKSSLGILKSLVSGKPQFDFEVVYRKALNLQLKLDAIKGGDPMIRNGKSAISKELKRFVNFIDEISEDDGMMFSSGVNIWYEGNNVKSGSANHQRKVGNAKLGDVKEVDLQKLRTLGKRIDKLAGVLDDEQYEVIDENPGAYTVPKSRVSVPRSRVGGLAKQQGGVKLTANKNVRFAENGKVYRVIRRQRDPHSDEYQKDSIDRDAKTEFEDDLCGQINEIGVYSKDAENEDENEDEEDEANSKTEGSPNGNGSDAENDSTNNFRSKRDDNAQTDDFTFCTPVPEKIEKRGGSVGKRKT